MEFNKTIDCPLWPTKPNQCTTVLAVQKTFASLSIIGCLFVIFTIIAMKMYKAFFQKLILSLAVAAIFDGVSYIIGNVYTEMSHFCRFQAFIMQFFDWSTLLWVLVITLYLLSVVLEKKLQEMKYFVAMHCFVWLSALFWAVIPFFGNKYGPAGIWCWIKRDHIALRFGVWYVPLFLICFSMLIIYAYIIVTVVKKTKAAGGATDEERQRNKRTRRELKPLLAYPMIFVILYTPAFMYRIDDASHEDKPPNFALTVISAACVPSIGVCNALSFAIFNATMHRLTWQRVKNAVLGWCASKPAHKIHENYIVTDHSAVNPSIEMEDSAYGSTSSTSAVSSTVADLTSP